MTEQEYIKYINQIRKKIKISNKTQLNDIEKNLEKLIDIRPYRLVYFLAKAELMTKQDLPRGEIIEFLENIPEHFFDQEELAELYKSLFHIIPTKEVLKKDKYDFLSKMYNRKEEINDFYISLDIKRKEFFESKGSIEPLFALANQYYIMQNMHMYFITILLWCKLTENINNYEKFIQDDGLKLSNIGYLFEQLIINQDQTFILVIGEQDNSDDYEVAAQVLKCFGKNVVVLDKEILCSITGDVNIADTLAISIENLDEKNGVKRFFPISLVKNNVYIGNNRIELISYITENLAKNKLAIVFSNDYMLDKLQSQKKLAKKFQRLSIKVDEMLKGNMAFGWTGDYLSYISYIYKFDVHKLIEQPTECEFSIVVPARNSATTLRHTLKTCLEQRYQENYEIILSDNSTNGNQEVYKLYCELNDPRIKYFKTPRDLPLAKSFEFAFLQAKGEFVFSIGSDDGVLPWALDTLHNVLNQVNDDILLWDRSFYAWPKFNGTQQNQFNINDCYKKGKIEIHKISSLDAIQYVLKNTNTGIYTMLPNLYLNSGYRRRYLKKLLNSTGRLWDGWSQDVYMGTINLGVVNEFSYISYPIVIAGMSSASIGYSSGKLISQPIDKQFNGLNKSRDKLGICEYVNSYLETLYPYILIIDVKIFYWALLRLVNLGLLEETLLEKLKWNEIYLDIVNKLNLNDVLFDKKIALLQQSAKKINKETEEYVDKICNMLFVPKSIKEKEETLIKRSYQIGFNENGHGMVLDASEFGVEDIYGAVKLFEKITGL